MQSSSNEYHKKRRFWRIRGPFVNGKALIVQYKVLKMRFSEQDPEEQERQRKMDQFESEKMSRVRELMVSH